MLRYFFTVSILLGFIFLCLSMIAGCAIGPTVAQAPAPQPKYQLLLPGSVDGVPFNGVFVGSADANHVMSMKSAIAVNYFTMQSCHRSVQFNDVIKVPWYDWADDSKSFSWNYNEAPTIEDTGDCLLRFCAFSNKVGAAPVACAVVDFSSPRYAMGFNNICNGVVQQSTGTAICQTQVGLLERAQFSVPMIVAPMHAPDATSSVPYAISGQCQGKFIDDNQTIYEYQMPENECVLIFDTKSAPHARAKLTVLPYDLPTYPGGT